MSQLEEINVRMISLHNSRKQIQQINDLLDVLDTKLSDLWRYKMSHVYESHILWLTQLLISSCRFLAINVHFKNSSVLFLAKWLLWNTLIVLDTFVGLCRTSTCPAPWTREALVLILDKDSLSFWWMSLILKSLFRFEQISSKSRK